MKKIIIIIFTFINALTFLAAHAAASTTGGAIGETIEFDSVSELLEYVENELWQGERWYVPSQKYTKVDYLKRMPDELFVPIGYTIKDIEKIKIDDVMVWIYLNDGNQLNYWFTEYTPNQKPSEICAPSEFRLLPGKDGVWDIPEVYNVFGQGEDVAVARPTEAGKNVFEGEAE